MRTPSQGEPAIFLDCGDHGVEVLRVQAAARNHERLIVPAGRARVEAGASVERVVLFYDYETNDEPPRPRLTAPAGVRAELGPWTLERKRRPAKGLPARWRGTLRIESLEETLPDDAAILIAVGPDHKVTVPITNNQ